MKTLVFLLVLVNLLFYAFSQGYFGLPENPDAGRVEKQVLAERMRIVSRGEVPAAPIPAPAPVPVVAPEPAKLEEAVEEVKTEASKKEGANKALAVAPVCLVWEHLSVADADRVNGLLAKKFAEFSVSRLTVAGEGNGWWVYIPPLSNKAEADKKAAELRELGVTDYFTIAEGQNRFAISLGVFSSEKGAQERLAELKEKGVRSAHSTPRPDKDGTISLRVSGPADAKANLLEAIGKALPKSIARRCK